MIKPKSGVCVILLVSSWFAVVALCCVSWFSFVVQDRAEGLRDFERGGWYRPADLFGDRGAGLCALDRHALPAGESSSPDKTISWLLLPLLPDKTIS